ncbi:MAG TPA: chorismate mutase, partial [Chthoniobacteraceae bacterium]|nr:chorismate mutase [Chthoniobacteraceae bacterium]
MTLPEIRKQIDALDEQLIALLNQRADLVHEVGVVKRAEGTEIYAPEREELVLRSLVARNAEHKGRL